MTKKLILLLCFVFAFAAVTMTADTWDKKTTLTFSRPVELPTMTLPAGTYVFKLSELGNRHLVMVYNAEETMLFTQILAIPNWQLTPKGETVLSFAERPKTEPEALRAWFYPGDNFGQEFVYPKRKALAIAEETKAPVLAAEITPEATPEQLAQEPVVAVTPEKKEVEVAQVIPPAPPEIAEAAPPPAPAPEEELPATGSPYPWIALLGTGALALGGVTKLAAKRL